jgi:mRNA interferase MazF
VSIQVKRGDIWTASGGKDYAGKARPVVIIQDNAFDATESITICAFTTDATQAPLFRIEIEASTYNGLREPCRLMVDKVTSIPKSKLGTYIGRLSDTDMLRINRALLVFLGLAGSVRN